MVVSGVDDPYPRKRKEREKEVRRISPASGISPAAGSALRRLGAPAEPGHAPALGADALGLLVGDVELPDALAGIAIGDPNGGALSFGDLLAGHVGDENRLAGQGFLLRCNGLAH